MTTSRAMELLYDSEATLRLVDYELDALREFTAGAGRPAAAGAQTAPASAPAPVPAILHRATAEIMAALDSLRQCRSQLRTATSDTVQLTHEKLREATSATEVAATDILDGLDRAHGLIDEMDAEAEEGGGAAERGKDLRTRLRDEIFRIAGCLQFQDITTQQLAYASTVLVEMETRLGEIAGLLGPSNLASHVALAGQAAPCTVPAAQAPDASATSGGDRQVVADRIVTTA